MGYRHKLFLRIPTRWISQLLSSWSEIPTPIVRIVVIISLPIRQLQEQMRILILQNFAECLKRFRRFPLHDVQEYGDPFSPPRVRHDAIFVSLRVHVWSFEERKYRIQFERSNQGWAGPNQFFFVTWFHSRFYISSIENWYIIACWQYFKIIYYINI